MSSCKCYLLFSPTWLGLLGYGGKMSLHSLMSSNITQWQLLTSRETFMLFTTNNIKVVTAWIMPRKGKEQPHTFSSNCTVRKQAKLPSLETDSQILFQISCPLLSFLEALTMLKTCFFLFYFLCLKNMKSVCVWGWGSGSKCLVLSQKPKWILGAF